MMEINAYLMIHEYFQPESKMDYNFRIKCFMESDFGLNLKINEINKDILDWHSYSFNL